MAEMKLNGMASEGPLAGLLPPTRRALERAARRAYYDTDARIFHCGTTARLNILASGAVKLVRHSATVRLADLSSIHGAGDMLETEAIFNGGIHQASAWALAPTVTIEVFPENLMPILEQDPRLTFRLLRQISEMSDALQDRLRVLAHGDARMRLAHLLVGLLDKFGARPSTDGTLIDLPLKRRDLADLSDLRVETVSRILQAWKSEEILDLQGSKLLIRDRKALRRIAAI